ncbi:MAG: hypothetical protein EOP52_01165 [Sphingobacteriales bacterium]|nr:MAG: hypothetical protein EOP52_01165 [Sphingobacteriales bacterium]
MTIEDIHDDYALCDGEILSYTVDVARCSFAVRLLVRKIIGKQTFQECKIELVFSECDSIDISEDFRTSGTYSDITLAKLSDGTFYLSLDPYGNFGEPHENDNYVIVGSSLALVLDTGDTFELS